MRNSGPRDSITKDLAQKRPRTRNVEGRALSAPKTALKRSMKDAIKRFRQVMYDTARWANGHRPDSAKILIKYAQLEASVVANMARCQYAVNLDASVLQPVLDISAKFGVIEKPMHASELVLT